HHAFSSGAGRTSDGNGSHASTLKSPSYTKSVSWQHYPKEDAVLVFKDWNMSGNSAFSDKTELPPGIQSLWDSAKEKIKPSAPDKSPE
ncbi:hypothetical protein OFN38_22640, partial [Escherichia coli]|nr:hypothetical protein [Escherichia coli]